MPGGDGWILSDGESYSDSAFGHVSEHSLQWGQCLHIACFDEMSL